MFEAKLAEGHILKKIVEAIKDIVTDVNIDVSASGKYLISDSTFEMLWPLLRKHYRERMNGTQKVILHFQK